MNNFLWGGRELSFRKGDRVKMLTSYQDLSIRPSKENKKYLRPTCRPSDGSEQVLHYGPRNIGTWRGDVRAVKLKTIILPMIIFCVLFSGLLVSPAQGQEADGLAKVKPLQIGDTIPEELWNMPLQVVNHPGGKEIITLNDYRDKKLIILDFWATFCAPCIKSVYKLDTLQRNHPDDIAVVLTSSESKKKIEGFFANRNISLFSAESQTVLKKYFPHNMVPHQIWIVDGVISFIPKSEQLTMAKMERFLLDGTLDVDSKRDVPNYSSEESLVSLANRTGVDVLKSSAVSPFIEGIPTLTEIYDQGSKHMAVYMNVNIPIIYQHLLNIPHNRILISSDDYSRFTFVPGQEEKLYCFQVVTPAEGKIPIRQTALDEANKIFSIRIDSVLIDRDVYVIKPMHIVEPKFHKKEIDPVFQKGHKRKMDVFVELLNFSVQWTPDQPIFLDESRFEGKVFTGTVLNKDISLLKRFLEQYKLTLNLEKRRVMMYVLHDTNEVKRLFIN